MTDSFNFVEPTPSSLLPPILPQKPLLPAKNSKDNHFFIYSGILFFILLIVCSFLVFNSKYIITISLKVNNKDTNSLVQNNSPVISTTPTLAPIPTLASQVISPKNSAKEAYLKMKLEQENFKIFDDYVAYHHKYGSKSERDFIDGVVKKLEPLSNDPYTAVYENNILGAVKAVTPLLKDITDIRESGNGYNTVLNISTNKPGVNGTINFVLEDGVWKFDREQWTQATNHTPIK